MAAELESGSFCGPFLDKRVRIGTTEKQIDATPTSVFLVTQFKVTGNQLYEILIV